ncbi:MAG: isochorismatase family protein [Nocardioidaceae bacterium]|nr:isochorismatase family protein [Nocardioidaceae bacterium]
MSDDSAESADLEFFAERGFGVPLGFGDRPAVVVVDLIRGFTDPTWPLGSDLTGQLAATSALLDAAHEAGHPVFLTTVRYDDPELRDAGVWGLKMKGASSLMAGTGGSDIDERLPVVPTDVVIVKKYASSFFGTDLASRLVSQGVDTVVITGATTSGCVRATAVDAVQLGFRPVVVREGVGDRSARSHEQSLFDLSQKYADVVGLDEAVSALEERALQERTRS